MSAAVQLAERIQAQANNLMTKEQARNVWLLTSTALEQAKQAEHQAFLAMRETEQNNTTSAADFCQFTRESLGALRDQLKAISGVLNAK